MVSDVIERIQLHPGSKIWTGKQCGITSKAGEVDIELRDFIDMKLFAFCLRSGPGRLASNQRWRGNDVVVGIETVYRHDRLRCYVVWLPADVRVVKRGRNALLQCAIG